MLKIVDVYIKWYIISCLVGVGLKQLYSSELSI